MNVSGTDAHPFRGDVKNRACNREEMREEIFVNVSVTLAQFSVFLYEVRSEFRWPSGILWKMHLHRSVQGQQGVNKQK